MLDKKLIAFLSVLLSIVLLGLAASFLSNKETSTLIVGIATGLVGVLKIPSWNDV